MDTDTLALFGEEMFTNKKICDHIRSLLRSRNAIKRYGGLVLAHCFKRQCIITCLPQIKLIAKKGEEEYEIRQMAREWLNLYNK